jgi:hypothetical protein
VYSHRGLDPEEGQRFDRVAIFVAGAIFGAARGAGDCQDQRIGRRLGRGDRRGGEGNSGNQHQARAHHGNSFDIGRAGLGSRCHLE